MKTPGRAGWLLTHDSFSSIMWLWGDDILVPTVGLLAVCYNDFFPFPDVIYQEEVLGSRGNCEKVVRSPRVGAAPTSFYSSVGLN